MSKPVRARKASVTEPTEPKTRKSVKSKRTKALEKMLDEKNDLEQQLADLKEDQMKIQGMNLKEIPLVVEDELQHLEADLKKTDAKYQQLLATPEETITA